MNTIALVPSRSAASATPCAWLPALAATTPAARSAGVSREIRTYAPRILNDPARWRFSHLSATGPPTRSDSGRDVSTGVSRATSPRSSRAASMSARVTTVAPTSMSVMVSVCPSRPVAIRCDDECSGADQPRVAAEHRDGDRATAGELERSVSLERHARGAEEQVARLGEAATDRDAVEVEQRGDGGEGDAERAAGAGERGEVDRVTSARGLGECRPGRNAGRHAPTLTPRPGHHRRPSSDRFQAAAAATRAGPPAGVDDDTADVSGVAR